MLNANSVVFFCDAFSCELGGQVWRSRLALHGVHHVPVVPRTIVFGALRDAAVIRVCTHYVAFMANI